MNQKENKLPIWFYIICLIFFLGIVSVPFFMKINAEEEVRHNEAYLYTKVNHILDSYKKGQNIMCVDYSFVPHYRTETEVRVDMIHVFNNKNKEVKYIEKDKYDLMNYNYFKIGYQNFFLYNCFNYNNKKKADYLNKYYFKKLRTYEYYPTREIIYDRTDPLFINEYK